MKKIIILSVVIIALSGLLHSEISANFLNPTLSQPSFFDLNKIQMNHTLSFQSGINSNNQGYYLSMYTNHLKFDIHPKLKINLDLHFTNFGTATYSKNFDIEGNDDNQSDVFPEIQMEYNPNDNIKIRLEFGRDPGYFYNRSFYDHRWLD